MKAPKMPTPIKGVVIKEGFGLKEMIKKETITNRWVIVNKMFNEIEVVLDIEQTPNRPNDPSDEDIVIDWIEQNHGYNMEFNFNWVQIPKEVDSCYVDENYCVET